MDGESFYVIFKNALDLFGIHWAHKEKLEVFVDGNWLIFRYEDTEVRTDLRKK